MSFILKIFFSGLIVFVTSNDGKQVTVILLNGSHQHFTANGPALEKHKPMLLTRGAGCKGDCSVFNDAVSRYLYPGFSAAAASEALAHAMNRGGVWELAGSDLSLNTPTDGVRIVHVESAKGKSLPDTVAERADFRWVASLKELDPASGAINPAVFAKNPPEDLIVARLQLTSGRLSTQSLIQVDGKVTPIEFRPLAGSGAPPVVRAAANWVEAEIKMPGNSITIAERDFAGREKREMTLTPENGVVELAILNIAPLLHPVAAATPQPGVHFLRYWDLVQHPRAANERPVPQLARTRMPQHDYKALHPDAPARISAMLHEIFLDDRSPYDQVLCPVGQLP